MPYADSNTKLSKELVGKTIVVAANLTPTKLVTVEGGLGPGAAVK